MIYVKECELERQLSPAKKWEKHKKKIHGTALHVILTFIAVLYLANKVPLFSESNNTFPSISYSSPEHSRKCEDIHARKVQVLQRNVLQLA